MFLNVVGVKVGVVRVGTPLCTPSRLFRTRLVMVGVSRTGTDDVVIIGIPSDKFGAATAVIVKLTLGTPLDAVLTPETAVALIGTAAVLITALVVTGRSDKSVTWIPSAVLSVVVTADAVFLVVVAAVFTAETAAAVTLTVEA